MRQPHNAQYALTPPATMACASVESMHPSTSATYTWTPEQSNSPPPYEFYDIFPSANSTHFTPNVSQSLNTKPAPIPPAEEVPPAPVSSETGSGNGRNQSNLSINHLREALSSLETRVASLLNEREMLESRLESAVRLQSPVQRLPNELMSSIFIIGVLGMDEEEDALMLSTLMLVCRYWRDVAVDTPVLWSRIVAGVHHPLAKARRKLERSKTVPLHIFVDFSPKTENGAVATESIVRTMDLLRTSVWRWKTFRLIVPNRPQAHAALMGCKEPAPLLEVLSVRILRSMQEEYVHTQNHANPPLQLFDGQTPVLRSCSFTSFNFGWEPSLLNNLRVLKLDGYWNGFSPSTDIILGILRKCPDLDHLVLRNMSDVDPTYCPSIDSDSAERESALVRVADTRMVQLPRLTKATFYYSGTTRTRSILSLLSCPALETIELCFLDDVSPMIEYLHRQSLTKLPLRHLRLESNFLSELKLLALLRRVPSLTSLELVDIEDASSNLMKNLAVTPSGGTWICPKLTHLSLEGCTDLDWESLRSFVESRLPAHSRAYPRHAVSSASASAAFVPFSSTTPTRPISSSTSSASAFAATAHILARTPVGAQSKASTSAVSWPQRLQSLDLTRCHQISKEMLQWLRMYVVDVRSEATRGVWGESPNA